MLSFVTRRSALLGSLLVCASPALAADAAARKPDDPGAAVSFSKQIRPILQAHCQGCHQPAKAKGDYVLTSFDKLLEGGESGEKPVVPHRPEESNLVSQVTPKDGKAKMPPEGKKPLDPSEVELIRRWVAAGAVDDSPAAATVAIDADHLPVYTRPPVIASIDFAPDGKLLAIAGFHEVLLVDPDESKLVGRLVGLAERIQAVRFAPDGKRLAVAGGLPGRLGEIQVWDVAKQKLEHSLPVGYDTLFGISWSPDGKLVAVGCGDNTVRAFDATTGEQVLFQGSHTDWPLDTVFSADGSHIVSVGRDGTAKLTEVATQRFVDNITSITPGALKGGILSVARQPQRDEIVVGGADGQPRVYRLFRLTARAIGDDSNLIRELPPLKGRVNGVAVSRDGKRIAACSSLDGTGEVAVYSYEFDTKLPDNIKAIMAKVATSRNPAEREAVEKYHKEDVKQIAKAEVSQAGVYAVAFRPDGKLVAAAGSDGAVRLIDAETGNVAKVFSPAPLSAKTAESSVAVKALTPPPDETPTPETLPSEATVTALNVQPSTVELTGRFAYVQLLVSAKLASGDVVDVTRQVEARLAADVATLTKTGLLRPKADGAATLTLRLNGQTATVPVSVSGMAVDLPADFARDVAPVLSRSGCNAGTCHGSAQGKNGFKLSLRGYDPIFDVRALTDDLASRRVTVASPDDSLMLLKPSGSVPHVGGQLFRPGEPYYETIRSWIANGAALNPATPRVAKIEVFPLNPVVQQLGAKQQLRVLATYADGLVRDVTRETFLESGNTDVATSSRTGLMTSLRRGEAPILARYEGAYAATTLTVMGDRGGFVWEQPPTYNRIDELTAAKWQRLKIKPSDVCTDAEFIRRVYLDLTGLPPTVDEVRAFLADGREDRAKREEMVDRLIGSPAYVEYWTNKWADLLQVNRKFLGPEGAAAFRKWIRAEVAADTPYDELVRKILTASGSNREHPEASYFKILREPAATMENTTHLFLGVRFNCNKCHDHPFERWTQDQYYHLSAYFARVGLKADPASGGKLLGGTAVEGGKPLYEEVFEKPDGEVLHDRTKQPTPPQFPFPSPHETKPDMTRRQELAEWVTSRDNPYFARSYVNRLWGYLFGVGIIEPIDDVRAGNPPSNPELLDHLTERFLASNFNAREILREICKSRTYQLSVATNKWNEDDKINYAHATARRLPAEVLYDAVHRVTGAISKIPGVPPGTRAAELPDSGVELPGGFLATLGRPVRESACECERTTGLQLGPVMALVNGPTIADAIGDPVSELAKLVEQEKDDAKLIDDLFLRILNRPATPKEVEASLRTMHSIQDGHQELVKQLAEREAYVVPIHAKQEQEREAAIAKAKEELAAHEKELAPKVAALEKEKAEQTAKLMAELKDYEAGLPKKLAEWEKAHKAASAPWVRLDPTDLKASRGAKLSRQEDLSVLARGSNAKSVYTFVAPTDLRGVTAFRLEVLADDRLPAKGPGRAPNGNFVLNQFEVTATARNDPKQSRKVEFAKTQADFAQPNFSIKDTVDGMTNGTKGWAVAGETGASHWAVLEAKEPVGYEGGTILTVALTQNYDALHQIGRFRLSVTTAATPVPLGLPDDVRGILLEPVAQRDAADQARLLAYFLRSDGEHQKRVAAVAESKKPLPTDPKLLELRATLATVSKPVPIDPKLLQLRQDVAVSAQQLGNTRLTGAQDVAWALINSPAFLFNR